MTHNIGTFMCPSQQHDFAGSRMCLITQKQVQLFPYKNCKGSNLWVRERKTRELAADNFCSSLRKILKCLKVVCREGPHCYIMQNVDCPGALWP